VIPVGRPERMDAGRAAFFAFGTALTDSRRRWRIARIWRTLSRFLAGVGMVVGYHGDPTGARKRVLHRTCLSPMAGGYVEGLVDSVAGQDSSLPFVWPFSRASAGTCPVPFESNFQGRRGRGLRTVRLSHSLFELVSRHTSGLGDK